MSPRIKIARRRKARIRLVGLGYLRRGLQEVNVASLRTVFAQDGRLRRFTRRSVPVATTATKLTPTTVTIKTTV